MNAPQRPCDCCGTNEALGVASIPGLPISVAYCRQCIDANIHPVLIVDCWRDLHDANNLADSAYEMSVYVDGVVKPLREAFDLIPPIEYEDTEVSE